MHLRKIALHSIAAVNVAVIVLMLISGYGGYINPENHPTASCFTLAFPLLMIANFAFLVFWIFVKLRYALIPFFGFVAAFGPVTTYTPFNKSSDPDSDCLKVITFNTWVMAGGAVQDSTNPVFRYLKEQDADIICLQEAAFTPDGYKNAKALFDHQYPYRDTLSSHGPGAGMLQLWSKYRILRKERIPYDSKGNASCAWYLRVGYDTVVVVNNHLESIGLTDKEKIKFKMMVKGDLSTDSSRKETSNLLARIGSANAKRAPQARAISNYLKRCPYKNIIVCGDFNSSPLAYAPRVVGKGLTDCYASSGFGPGISYHRGGFYVRIDHMFCSLEYKPVKCIVDRSMTASDHYPVICWLKKKP